MQLYTENLIVGSGLTGLLIADRLGGNKIILDQIPSIGGFLRCDKLFGSEFPLFPGVLDVNCIDSLDVNYLMEQAFLKSNKFDLEKALNKLWSGLNKQIIYPITFANKEIYYPKGHWCKITEELYKKAKYPRLIVDYIRKMDLGKRLVITSKGHVISFNRMFYSGSLVDLLSLINVNTLNLFWISSVILFFLIRRKISEWRLIINDRPGIKISSIIIKPSSVESFEEVYILITGLIKSIPSNPKEIIFKDLKRIGFSEELSNSVAERKYMEYYGYLIENSNVNGIREKLNEYNIDLIGRLAEWRNYSICEIIKKIQSI